MARTRIGAVSYLNTLPLVHGLRRGLGADRLELSYSTPAELADRMAAGELDVALLPVIELARIRDLELIPGLGIVTQGPSRSVLLVAKRPAAEVRSLALDRDSRTSNALVRVLLADVWGCRPRTLSGATSLDDSLREADATVRIGDKALFETPPSDAHVYDLGEVWTRETGLPFVYAAWTARPGVVDRELYGWLHDSRREGSRAIDRIAAEYTWRGAPRVEVAKEYLTRNIGFRLGSDEIRAMELFFSRALALDLIETTPQIRLALRRWTGCDEMAAERELVRRPIG